MSSANTQIGNRVGSRSVLRRDKLYAAVSLFRNILFVLFVLRWTRRGYWQLKGRGLVDSVRAAYNAVNRVLYNMLLKAPGVRNQVRVQVAKSVNQLESMLVPKNVTRYLKLPEQGWSADKVELELNALVDMDHTRWEDGRVSGAVYSGKDDMIKLQTHAFEKFAVSNPIHPDVFPGVRKMEAEVVAMVLSIFNAPEGAAGATTSGGTESILMACLGARQKAYAERGVVEPEMIIPDTAHAAFLKAGEYFRIKVHRVRTPAPDYKVQISAVSRLINTNTILLVGSAPNFPHGIIDDIPALSKLAVKYKIPLHVDCCLGSFIVPFLTKAGYDSEPFDFRVKGVTSISCDTHKYAFAPKGTSTILYRTAKLRAYQYFITTDWSGGVYASPSMAGSRSGAVIAGCWASLMAQGENGYIAACHSIVGAAKKIENAIREQPSLCSDLKVIGKPLVSVVAFTSTTLNIYDIADGMSGLGWHLNALQNPAAIHVAVTVPIVSAVDSLLRDLEVVVEREREKERVRVLEGRKKGKGGNTAALYGVAGSVGNTGIVRQLAGGFLDTLYKA